MVFLFTFRRLLIISVALILWVLWLTYSDTRTKEYYASSTGKILYLENTYQELPTRNHGKMRYILLDNYPSVFEIFVGKDASDFKPKYEKIDSLRVGQVITIFYNDRQTISTKSTNTINSSVQYIEKDGELFFEKGNSKRMVSAILIFLSVFLSVLGLILWQKRKIPY